MVMHEILKVLSQQEQRKMPQNFRLASLENQFMNVSHDELTRSVICHYKINLSWAISRYIHNQGVAIEGWPGMSAICVRCCFL
jgi:hypothetical protein